MVILESAGITDVGRRRKGNEDTLFIDDALKLYMVADGMGGHQAGEVASKLVVDTIRDYILSNAEKNDDDSWDETDGTLSNEAERIRTSITIANKRVHDISKVKNTYAGMGSTISAVYFSDDTLIAANVGDSHIYLIHNGKIDLISVVHNVITEQSAINPERAQRMGKQFQHMLTRAMGVEENVKPDISEIQIFKDDMLIVCSDGLTDNVAAEEILDVSRLEQPEKICHYLVKMANDRGGHDNITVVAVKVKAIQSEKNFIFKVLSRISDGLINFPKKIFK
jgi:serine/threonine protein phosphatase PrpC